MPSEPTAPEPQTGLSQPLAADTQSVPQPPHAFQPAAPPATQPAAQAVAFKPLPFLQHEFLADRAARLAAVIVPAMPTSVAAAAEFVAAGEAALAADPHAFQAVEWRVDYLEQPGLDDSADTALVARCGAVWQQLQRLQVPILATVRTRQEGGGEFDAVASRYQRLVAELAELPLAAIDLEHRRDGVPELAALAAARGITVVLSHHDWAGTPRQEELVALLRRLTAVACGKQSAVVKVAVTPHTAADVAVLAAAAREVAPEFDGSLIAIAMGKLGQVTRGLHNDYGSAATFAALTKTSAPGQLTVAELSAQREKALRQL